MEANSSDEKGNDGVADTQVEAHVSDSAEVYDTSGILLIAENSTTEVQRIELVAEKPYDLNLSMGVDVIAFLGFAITALIVLLTNRQTVKYSLKLIESQERLSRKSAEENVHLTRSEITANNRQAWINTLRNDVADFIAAAYAIWDLNRIKSGRRQTLSELGNPEYAMKELFEWSSKYNQAIERAEGLSAKIKLLTNPVEDKTKELVAGLDAAMNRIRDGEKPEEHLHQIVLVSQSILKEEWERVKEMK
ncbi:hypothetical protein [Halomonas sp. BC2]|uniref:hypothetical protein n=1 Tax=Halomonas sp. BC2 TaxID=1670449 RepID=UPI0011183494|nr:hypothetical protein [Halomonas sp. BC2]